MGRASEVLRVRRRSIGIGHAIHSGLTLVFYRLQILFVNEVFVLLSCFLYKKTF